MTDDGSLDLFDDLEEPEPEPEATEGVSGGTEGASEAGASTSAGASRSAEGAADAGPKVWSVSQVNRAVRGLLESSVEPLWVGGEIGNWTRSRAGHCYFTLKDERAQLRSVMFAREAQRLPTDPDEGTKVRVYGDLTLYEARGEYQLVVRKLEADGADGLWRKAFEELRARLEAEGLLAPERKRPLPRYPRCVGVVTSPTGAAFRDILSVLARRAPWTTVLLRGSRVQGEGASEEIAAALRRLDESGRADVIIVGRGGGSLEDLWAFNEEPVARAIAECRTPVVSAVGHEVDVTISDLVADLRAPTPSAAAEAVAPDRAALLTQLRRAPERLGRGLRRAGARRRDRVAERLVRLGRLMERRVTPLRRALELGGDRLERRMTDLTRERRSRLEGMSGRLEALSPLSTLSRGYSVARGPDGEVLRRVDQLKEGVRFHLRVSDGTVEAESRGMAEDAS
ncbi:MAG: exodeoxyribonuclease VII large subunit [Longimicrobiales bacterium]|nr:exodeoxyribonuclease VII large subunit [Longimicrobiales bacterium]